ncbi:trypsin-1-like [Penaeus indicus]|uniref:trypsin-1-like n=1 Tax=Penaeus indicus TaxID=29960 RepID=UPI00300CB3DF
MRLIVLLLLVSVIEGALLKPRGPEGASQTSHEKERDRKENDDKQQEGRSEKEMIGWKQRKNERVDLRSDTKNVAIQDICDDNIVLSYGQSAVFYSDNDQLAMKCRLKVKTPPGTDIGLNCMTWNIYRGDCKKESLFIKYKSYTGRKEKLLYCENVSPVNRVYRTNKILMTYKRKRLDITEFSGGFVCEVRTVGGSARPYCDGCGFMSINVDSNRIVNGSNASPREYPYQVIVRPSIGTKVYSCGGSIIKRNWILTAAHCFFDLETGLKASSVEVRYGSINYFLGTSVTSTDFITHRDYDSKTWANDIALVKLPEPLQYQSDPNIRPICLGLDEDNLFSGKGVATGWGRLYYNGTSPTILQEVELDIISMSECAAKISLPADPEKVMCSLTPYKDTCQGDSGGPFVVPVGFGRWVQVGIVSYGIECARPKYPNVYTRVSAYIDWISCNSGGSECDST